MGLLSDVSPDIIASIACYLRVSSVLNLAATSKAMRFLISDSHLWEEFCVRDFRIKAYSFPRSAEGWLELYKNIESPVVLTWGQNRNGRLRHTGWDDIVTPTQIDTTPFGSISAMSCSGYGMHALNQKGEVWFWGMLDDNNEETTGSKIALPEPARSISSGRTFGCALADSGAAYTWTAARSFRGIFDTRITSCTPSKPQYPWDKQAKAKSIVAGWSHVAMLLADGSIKTCHIDRINTILDLEPFHLSTDPSDPIIRLAAGDHFTVALSKRGSVYLWREVGCAPASSPKLDADDELDLRGQTFTHVSACLHNLSLFDSTSGLLRAFDMNRRRETTSQWMANTHNIATITTGDWHAGALLTNGEVWTWGNGSCALGLGRNGQVEVHEPERIQSGLDGLFVFDIAFGGWHSAALAFRVNN
ncbi:unnamed protein product [Aphanomyces euteiches]